MLVLKLLLLALIAHPGSCWLSSLSRRGRSQLARLAEPKDSWSDLPLNEVFFKQGGLEKLERDLAEAESRKLQEDQTKLGTMESTTRRMGTASPPRIDSQPQQPDRVSDVAGSPSKNATAKLPFLDVESIGLKGRWIERSGNFILRPPQATSDSTIRQPLGVIHFLGGAFVGAAPHLTYRYLLESLSEAGYVVVATPYRLDFDYVRSCDTILTKFDAVAVELAAEYGPVPVIGLGHSCGALLQVLITSLFPDAPRAANVLISFNNRPAAKSIPGLDEIVVPLSEALMQDGEQGTSSRGAVAGLRSTFESSLQAYADSALAPSFINSEVLPLLQQGIEIVDQIPPLLRDIASGTREFSPTPADTKEVCRRMYRARRTLLLKFDNDDLDESVAIEKVLREANTIMRMKRPMVEMDVELRILTGTHITPLTQDVVLEPPEGVPDLLEPLRSRVRSNFLQTVDEVNDAVISFLSPLTNIKAAV